MSQSLVGYRVVHQADGKIAFFRPDGTFAGFGRPVPRERWPATWTGGGARRARRHTPPAPVKHAAGAVAERQGSPALPASRGRYLVLTGALHVDREVRQAAQEAADLCADDLGIARRDVCWFDDATPARLVAAMKSGPAPERFDAGDVDGCLGVFRPDRPSCVYVKLTDDPRLAAEVAAHETRHRWQFRTRGKPLSSEIAAYEADARAYSDRFVAWLDAQGGTTW